jgi:methylenetetrahydrofolate dehydrogenase (NADP+)/methenyltetrahydrofolate cyclohydrolase
VSARVIDGRAAAALLRAEFVPRIERLRERTNITPRLAVILVGNNAASSIYVSNKVRACEELENTIAAAERAS